MMKKSVFLMVLCLGLPISAGAAVLPQTPELVAQQDVLAKLKSQVQNIPPENLRLSRQVAEAQRPRFAAMRVQIFNTTLQKMPPDIANTWRPILEKMIRTDELIDIVTYAQAKNLNQRDLTLLSQLAEAEGGPQLLSKLPGLAADTSRGVEAYLNQAVSQLIDSRMVQKALDTPSQRPEGRPSQH